MTEGYLKLPPIKSMPDSRTLLRQLPDEEWRNYVFFFLLKYSNEVDKQEVIKLIDDEKRKERAQIETVIKKNIRNWLKRRCAEFNLCEFILNREPSSENEAEGYYDLKFEHSQWSKYFSFEAKNLGAIKSFTLSQSIDEYVYVKAKDDGGMYRYVINKYACDLDFGGMIGFVINESNTSILDSLINKIQTVFCDNSLGALVDDKIVMNSIADNPNTFETIHSVKHEDINKNLRLYHILIDFTKQID